MKIDNKANPIELKERVEPQKLRNPQVMKAARLYEAQFLREMVKQMRKTVPEDGLMAPNMAEKIFREQLDDKTVDNWVDRGGVGIADLIHDQIIDRYSQYLAPQTSPSAAAKSYKKNSE